MPNIHTYNYPPDTTPGHPSNRLTWALREACLGMHLHLPVLGKWTPRDIIITPLGPNPFPDLESPIQVIVDILYSRPDRTYNVLVAFRERLADAVKSVYPNHPVEVVSRPLLDSLAVTERK